MPKNLWLTEADTAALRKRVAGGHPHAAALWRTVQPYAKASTAQLEAEGFSTQLNRDPRVCVIQSASIGCLLTGESHYAQRAADEYAAWTDTWTGAELTSAHWGLVGSVVLACCEAALDERRLARLVAKLAWCVETQREVPLHSGNPHAVWNNHWAVSHSGAMLAAMSAHGRAAAPGGAPLDMSEAIAWSRGRVRAFATQIGDAGLYHEGLGYTLYTYCFLLPALIASRNFDGVDLASQIPGVARAAESFFAAGADRPAIQEDGTPADPALAHGMMLSWNDAGQGWPQDAVTSHLIALARRDDPRVRGALRTLWDRLSGHAGPGIFTPGFGGYFFALVHYPYDAEPVGPQGVLPRRVTDHRQGLHFARNRYADADDAVLGFYAKTTFAGGHKQEDAGSLRFMALGYDWCMGGGQARTDRAFQTTCFPADGSGNDSGLCPILLDEADPTLGPGGGVFACEMRKPSASYHERYVAADYSGAGGCDAVIALLDQIDDHKQGRDWCWTQTFEPRLTPRVHDDGHGFTLDAPDGASMQVRFVGSAPAELTVQRMPDSKRTYQGGHTVHYPGRPYIQARFTGRRRYGILAVMTVTRGTQPEVAQEGGGVGVRIGEHVWARPFGAAVPTTYVPGASGSLCKYPSGLDDFRAPFPANHEA